jgi:hemerythrin-like domain-containing protein
MVAVDVASPPHAVLRLRAEHERVEDQLAVLAANASCLHKGDALEVAEMLEGLRALHDYIEEVHQPREDAALELVAARARVNPEIVGELERQHERLHEVGTRLVDQIERIATDAPVSRREVENDLEAFVVAMRAHMALEERAFFPLAERMLTAAEWMRIDATLRP